MASIKELNEATGTSEPQPQAAPLNFDHVTSAGDIFSFISKGLKESFTAGNRNNYCHVYASDANRFGISESDCFGYLAQYAEKDFPQSEIRQAVRSAYERTGEHGSKEYKTGTRQTAQPIQNSPQAAHVSTIPPTETINILKNISSFQINLSEELPPPQPAINFNGVSIGTLGNFSTITGKAKSRKSFLATMFAGAVLSGEYFGLQSDLTHKTMIYFDTEQSKYYVQKLAKRIVSISQNEAFLKVFTLRTCSPLERMQIIEHTLKNTPNIGLCVIDGVRDLVTSINDEEQATMINTKLLNWTEIYNCHIVVILHQNKGNDQARGHIGTELMNKAETVLSVTRDDKNTEMSLVKFDYCKNINPAPFAFSINEHGIPEISDYQFTSVTEKTFDKIQRICTDIFSGQRSLTYGEVVQELICTTKTKERTAKTYFKTMTDGGLVEQGIDKRYRLKT